MRAKQLFFKAYFLFVLITSSLSPIFTGSFKKKLANAFFFMTIYKITDEIWSLKKESAINFGWKQIKLLWLSKQIKSQNVSFKTKLKIKRLLKRFIETDSEDKKKLIEDVLNLIDKFAKQKTKNINLAKEIYGQDITKPTHPLFTEQTINFFEKIRANNSLIRPCLICDQNAWGLDFFLEETSRFFNKTIVVLDCNNLTGQDFLAYKQENPELSPASIFLKLFLQLDPQKNLLILQNIEKISDEIEQKLFLSFLKNKNQIFDPTIEDWIDLSDLQIFLLIENTKKWLNISNIEFLHLNQNLKKKDFSNQAINNFLNKEKIKNNQINKPILYKLISDKIDTQDLNSFLIDVVCFLKKNKLNNFEQINNFTNQWIKNHYKIFIKNIQKLSIQELKQIPLGIFKNKGKIYSLLKQKQNEIKNIAFNNNIGQEQETIRHFKTLLQIACINNDSQQIDLRLCKKILDQEIGGLQKEKEIFLSLAALAQVQKTSTKPICLIGPPGVGKTLLAQTLAKALNKEFYKISAPSLVHSGQLTGMPRSYQQAEPGCFAQAMLKSKSQNIIFVFDEFDKLIQQQASLIFPLLEIFDPLQNHNVFDNYLGVSINLSNFWFIMTANDISHFPDYLKDRIKCIFLKNYSAEEKAEILLTHHIPKILKKMDNDVVKNINFNAEIIKKLINQHSNESLRTLQEKIEDLIAEFVKNFFLEENGK